MVPLPVLQRLLLAHHLIIAPLAPLQANHLVATLIAVVLLVAVLRVAHLRTNMGRQLQNALTLDALIILHLLVIQNMNYNNYLSAIDLEPTLEYELAESYAIVTKDGNMVSAMMAGTDPQKGYFLIISFQE